MPVTLTVREVMEQPVVKVSSDHTVSQALDQMIKADVWSLLIEKQGLPIGVVTDRDILIRCVAKGRAPDLVKVEEIMSSPLITIEADKRAGEALHIMVDKRVRRLYIVDQGKVVGRVTQTGLSRSLLDVMITIDSVTHTL